MKLNRVLCVIVVCLGVFACKSDGSGESENSARALEKEVLAIHDEVMPRMGEIESLRESLVSELENTALDSQLRVATNEAISRLELGDSLMWDWMHNYSIPENVSNDSVVKYLENEKRQITQVRQTMQGAITGAEGLLQKLGHSRAQ